MSIRGKLISEIAPAEVFELITQQAPEDAFLEFKHSVLHRRKPNENSKKENERLEKDRDDLAEDLVSFANAAGGHIIIGVGTDAHECAVQPAFMTGDEATRIAQSLRDLAIAYIEPPIKQLEILPFAMDTARSDWVVIARIPPNGEDKPHMATRRHRTQFMIRSGNRKRTMNHVEIQTAFVNGPQQQLMSSLLSEIESIRSSVEELRGQKKE